MDTQDTQGGNEELDPGRCQYVYPEGHEHEGEQCQGARYSTGYCAPHSKLMLAQQRASGAPSQPDSLSDAVQAAQAAQERAQASLTASAAAWLADPKTQKRLRKRWDDILDAGADSELIRLVKELTDRVEGRAGEARPEEELTVPSSVEALRALSAEQRRALLLQHARH